MGYFGINLENPGANQTVVSMGSRDYCFSYQTCIAYRDVGSHVNSVEYRGIRRDHTYSRTTSKHPWNRDTSKHMTQMGVKDWTQVSDEEFEKIVAAAQGGWA